MGEKRPKPPRRNAGQMRLYAEEAEIATLGACLLSREAIGRCADMELQPAHFYHVPYQLMYRAVLRLDERGAVVDPVTLSEELQALGQLEQAGGMPAIAELMDAAPTAANVQWHARVVLEMAQRRLLVEAAQETIDDVYDTHGDPVGVVLDRAQQRVFAIEYGRRGGPEPMRGMVGRSIEGLEQRMMAGGKLLGAPTGYPELDEMLGGLQPGNLYVLAARPSMGKTALAMGIALNAALSDDATPSLFFSMEMSKEQLVARALCHEALADLGAYMRGTSLDEELVRIAEVAGQVDRAPIWIDDRGGLTVMQVRSGTRRLMAERPDLGLVVVDYLQLMEGPGENRTQVVGGCSRGLKALAKELHVPVLALCQLSRKPEERSDHRPQLSDLRESGDIEQDADSVMFLYRPEYYMSPLQAVEKGVVGKAEVIIAKQRNGPTGTVELVWRKQYARFEPAVAGTMRPKGETRMKDRTDRIVGE